MPEGTEAPAGEAASTSKGRREGKRSGGRFALIAGVLLVVIALAVGATTSLFAATLDRSSASAVIGQQELQTDGILAQATVTNVDPLKSEMQIRLAMDHVGSLDNEGLLARPVTLYYSSVDGTKQIDFKKDKPLGATDLMVPLLGDSVASYPWDRYQGDIELTFVTTSDAPAPPAATTAAAGEGTGNPPEAKPADAPAPLPDTVVASSLTVYEQVPAYNVLEVAGTEKDGVLGATFNLRRAPTAIFFSLLVTFIMWALAIGVMLIAVSVVQRRRKFELALITMMAAILFAMPAALRGFQPGIPPPGVLSDFYGFFWCDVIVAISLVTVVTVYLRRGTE